MIKGIIIIAGIIYLGFIYCACRAAGDADAREEDEL